MSMIITTLIIQSIILSIYNGVTQTQESYILLLDIFLLLGQYGQNLSLILLIGSICLSNELLIADENIKCYYLSMRFTLSATVLLEKQKSIYFIFCLFYLLFRQHLYQQILSYLSIFGYFIILISCLYQTVNKANFKNSSTQQLIDFFKVSIPVPLCIIRNNQYLFQTNQFKTDYIEITPQIIRQISSNKDKDYLTNYLSNRRNNLNSNQYYNYQVGKKLENCNFFYCAFNLNLFFLNLQKVINISTYLNLKVKILFFLIIIQIKKEIQNQ